MKKLIVLITVFALVFSLVACGKDDVPDEPVIEENVISGLVTSEGGFFIDGVDYDQFGLCSNDNKNYYFVITDKTELVWNDTSAFDYWIENTDPWKVFCGYLYVDVVYGDEFSFPYIEEEAEGIYEAISITVTGTDEKYASQFGYSDKPVIYLYPEEETEVSVTLDYNGKLTCTYPTYNGGWNVTAYPDGTLIDENGQEYNYLYWEGITDVKYDFSKGFCIKGEDTAAFLETALEELGLTRREANEFIVYWLPMMEQNPYNIISFQTDIYTENASLNITPTPDTLIRVFMAWYGVDAEIDIEPQELSAPKRECFTVVEWGGTEVR